ncbi:MAG: purine-binding chemotaxis protein CheW [Treponema sp.]|uniref:chemotaxis protein CheW n=1 Tax=Treponema sp. TaxID=166 RepID=UPI001B411B61|nr:chemotaxis protein CheW [Treponema sp.]MBP5402561.1 purine-binding chemotaxis protein CheW [Treponema sp.]MBR5933854.1 purine-binding chemotaxis protein CheW [Treponema sp.]
MTDESFFTFSLGEGTFALPVQFVREVLNYEPITSVPKALPYLKGVMNIRGSVVTVVDFRELFGFKSQKSLEKCSIIVLEIEQEGDEPLVLGMIADSVDVVTKLEFVVSENYDFGTLPGRKDFILKVAKNADNFILVLDIKKILESIEKEIGL